MKTVNQKLYQPSWCNFVCQYPYDLSLSSKHGKKKIRDWFRRVLGWNKNLMFEGTLTLKDSEGITCNVVISNNIVFVPNAEKMYVRHTINLEVVE